MIFRHFEQTDPGKVASRLFGRLDFFPVPIEERKGGAFSPDQRFGLFFVLEMEFRKDVVVENERMETDLQADDLAKPLFFESNFFLLGIGAKKGWLGEQSKQPNDEDNSLHDNRSIKEIKPGR